MYNVQFPGLGISVNINPVAFSIGSMTVKWYGVIIAVGFLLAFLYAMKSCKKMRIDDDKFLDVVIVGIIGGIIGARAYYVLFDTSSQYIINPVSALYIWEGGLGIYGGIIGGLLCGALMAKHRKLSVLAVMDVASLGFLIGQTIGRWGNFVNQEAFGVETSLPWGMTSEATSRIASGPVHPCFLYESLWCLLGFVLLHIFSRKFRRYDGQVFLLYIIWYGVGRFFIEGLRTDSLITPFLPIRVSQLVAVISVIAAVVLLIVFRKRTVLTGCGSKKIMELNSLVDEIPEDMIDDGTSTVFETIDLNDDANTAPSETGDETHQESEHDANSETSSQGNLESDSEQLKTESDESQELPPSDNA